MTLYEKIMALYPSLTTDDFLGPKSTILLENALDDRGDYIAKWEHPTLPKPTEEQLA
jgi:hypothetical protein